MFDAFSGSSRTRVETSTFNETGGNRLPAGKDSDKPGHVNESHVAVDSKYSKHHMGMLSRGLKWYCEHIPIDCMLSNVE